MQQETHSIPKRLRATGSHMETRPIYIEEWLDSLPYIDFNKTSKLLLEATALTNEETIKPEVRQELVSLYNRPFRYYLESQIKSGAQLTPQAMETMQDQIGILKQIANNLARSCAMSIEEGQNRKTIWRQKKSPLPIMAMNMNFLSLALIFSYLEYAPAPGTIWHELNGIYAHGENLGQQLATVIPPGGDAKKDATTLASIYKAILLASMVDPYRLPFGAIWEIYFQCRRWTEHVQIKPFTRVDAPEGIYVIDLDGDSFPVAYGKFEVADAGVMHRIIDTTRLGPVVTGQLEQLNSGKPLDEEVQLSAVYARSILDHMSMAWGQPAMRNSPRDKSDGTVQVSFGMNAIYYYLNGEHDFVVQEQGDEEAIIMDVGGLPEPLAPKSRDYTREQWKLVDQGPGGFAIGRTEKPEVTGKVGDLVGIAHSPEGSLALGVIRWLVINSNADYRVGVQTIAADMVPAAIRAVTGSAMETRFNRAFIAGDFNPSGNNTVICATGLYRDNRQYDLSVGGETLRVRSESVVETTATYNHFIVAPLK